MSITQEEFVKFFNRAKDDLLYAKGALNIIDLDKLKAHIEQKPYTMKQHDFSVLYKIINIKTVYDDKNQLIKNVAFDMDKFDVDEIGLGVGKKEITVDNSNLEILLLSVNNLDQSSKILRMNAKIQAKDKWADRVIGACCFDTSISRLKVDGTVLYRLLKQDFLDSLSAVLDDIEKRGMFCDTKTNAARKAIGYADVLNKAMETFLNKENTKDNNLVFDKYQKLLLSDDLEYVNKKIHENIDEFKSYLSSVNSMYRNSWNKKLEDIRKAVNLSKFGINKEIEKAKDFSNQLVDDYDGLDFN